MVLPGWLAVMLQVPAATPVTVLPETLQMVGVVLLEKLTARPDVAIALSVLAPPMTMLAGVTPTAPMDWVIKKPLPLKLTLCGLPTALLLMVRVPVRLPVADGVKVKPRLQKPPAPRPPPHVLLVTANSALAAMLPTASVSAAPPVLVKTTVCSALVLPTVCAAKVRDGRLSDTSATGVPVPFKVTVVVGLASASLLITRLPLKAPTVIGENVILMLQLLGCANVALQVLLLIAKSPLATLLLMLSTAPPVLLRVTVLAVLVVPTPCEPKFHDVGLATLVLPWPVPVSAMLCGLPGALLAIVMLPLRVPIALGVNVMSSVQLPPKTRPLPQLWLTAYSALAVMLRFVSAAVPVLVSVTCWAVLVLPIFCRAKVREADRPEIAGASKNVAVTDFAASMVTVQVAAAPALAQAPPQAIKFAAGVAVSVTSKPRPALPLQVLPQLIGPPLTLPAPVLTTLNGTVSRASKEPKDCPARTRRT